jgi:ABC-type microcin C transport system duplicated ATPase subunit YejF
MESNNNQTRSDDNSIILDDDKIEIDPRIRETPPGSKSGEYNFGSAFSPTKRNRKRSYSEEKVMKEPFLKEEKDRVKKEKKRKDPTFVEARDFHQVVFENIDLTAQFEDPETHEILSKQVLQNVSGKAQSGQILGIIGNSGTGKTSLLRVLRGEIFIKRGEKASGNLLIDGIPINIQHNKEEMKKLYGIEEKDAQHEHQAKIQPPQPQSVKGKLDVNFIGEVSGGSIYVMILTRAIRQQKNTDRVRSASCSSKLEHNISQRHLDWLL